jgi:gas vesicle protein
MADKTGTVDFVAGFLVGALVGAAAALLLAPQSGEETRTLIRDKGIEIREHADELSAEARKRAEELQLQAKGKADDLQAKLKEAMEEGKTAATTRKEELLAKIEGAPDVGAAPDSA